MYWCLIDLCKTTFHGMQLLWYHADSRYRLTPFTNGKVSAIVHMFFHCSFNYIQMKWKRPNWIIVNILLNGARHYVYRDLPSADACWKWAVNLWSDAWKTPRRIRAKREHFLVDAESPMPILNISIFKIKYNHTNLRAYRGNFERIVVDASKSHHANSFPLRRDVIEWLLPSYEYVSNVGLSVDLG